jgi:hypothetical protein
VTPGLAVWKPAFQAAIAASWADEPAPLSSPDMELPELLEPLFPEEPLLLDSLAAPQALRPSATVSDMAPSASTRGMEVRFTLVPLWDQALGDVDESDARECRCPVRLAKVYGK